MKWLRSKRLWVVVVLAAIAAGATAVVVNRRSAKPAVQWETTPVDRGRIVARVTATGTLSALVTVQVGSQVSGSIQKLFADFNSPVKKGQLIAKIDPRLFQAALENARANFAQAKATLMKDEVQARFNERQSKRQGALVKDKLIAPADFDTAESAAGTSLAQVEADKANVQQARAILHQAEVNMELTNIVSPTDGVVISRNVDVGQTVAASLSAPIIFVIAEDLRKMQVDTSVAEADVGKLTAGMDATFMVDAYPGERFKGKVRQIRNAAQTVQNVVTYDAVIDVNNSDLKLRPGMTANVNFVFANREDVLRVPNAALRFRPSPELLSRDQARSRKTRPKWRGDAVERGCHGGSVRASGRRRTPLARSGRRIFRRQGRSSESAIGVGAERRRAACDADQDRNQRRYQDRSGRGGSRRGRSGHHRWHSHRRRETARKPIAWCPGSARRRRAATLLGAAMAGALIEVSHVSKVYRMGDVEVHALRDVSLAIAEGESVAVMGPSGSGKSTLMNILGCLDWPTAGSYHLVGEEVSTLDRNALARLRNRTLGFVFQSFNLLARTSALENVELPLLYSGVSGRERHRRAREALEKVGLGDRLHHHPNQMSGGQQQRVAVARALVTQPRLMVADEPTGNLDSRTSVEIMALFQELGRSGITLLLVTHEPDIARYASRVVVMRDGLVQSDRRQAPLVADVAAARAEAVAAGIP